MVKKIGKLEVWNERGFGLISIRGENFKIEQFFLNFASIIVCEPEVPHSGCTVKFHVSPNAPNPGKLRLAVDVEVYKSATAKTVRAAQVAESSTTEAT